MHTGKHCSFGAVITIILLFNLTQIQNWYLGILILNYISLSSYSSGCNVMSSLVSYASMGLVSCNFSVFCSFSHLSCISSLNPFSEI